MYLPVVSGIPGEIGDCSGDGKSHLFLLFQIPEQAYLYVPAAVECSGRELFGFAVRG